MRSIGLLPMLLLASCATGGGSALDRIEVRPAKQGEMATSESAYVTAKRQLALGNVGLAIDSFRKAARDNPQSADALNGLAVAYDRIGRHDLSRQAYEEALALAPADTAILHNLKRSLTAQGLHAEAARLAVEMGETPAPVAVASRPATPPVSAPIPRELRLERISVREVALVTNRRRNGWDVVAEPRPPATASAAAAPRARPYAISKSGALELALPIASQAEPMVTVLNAAGKRGLARRMSGYLREQGWNRTTIGDSRTRAFGSYLVHAPKDRLSAVMLAKTLPFRPRLVVSGKARSVILLLGRNAAGFAQPGAPAAS